MRGPLETLARLILSSSALALITPTVAAAQNDCGVDYADLWRAVAQGSPSETHFFTRVTVRCDDGSEIYADSAIVSPTQRLSQFFGNVTFTEEGRELNADRATYRNDIDRLDAFGNVSLIDTTGSELEGDNLVYLRGGGNQQGTHLTMTGLGGAQPRALIVPGQSSSDSIEADTTQSPPPVDSLTVLGAPDTLAIDTLPPDPPPTDTLPPELPPTDTLPPEPVVPYEVTADRIIIDGSDTFRGEGRVEVTRETLHATGQNMVYESGKGELLMVGDAKSEGEGYDLTADAITVVLPNDKVEAIVARGSAALATDDLDLTAPKIQIFVDTEKLQRLVAAQLGPGDSPVTSQSAIDGAEGDTRATALTQDFLLYGDSLEVVTPDEELERVTAIGRARGEAFGQDTLRQPDTPELAQQDWLEGDTIIATFVAKVPDTVPTPAPDTVATRADTSGVIAGFLVIPGQAVEEATATPANEKYTLDRLVALGGARSLYRMSPSDTTGTVEPGRVALHYVVGDGITILMVDGEVDRMEVSGQTQGFHLEPVAFTRAGDSISADSVPADSLGVDTLRVDTLPSGTSSVDMPSPDTLPTDTLAIDTLPPDTVPSREWGQSTHSGVVETLTIWAGPAPKLTDPEPYRPSRRTFWPTH